MRSMSDARSINEAARMLEEKIAKLEADRAAAPTRAARRPINQRIHSLRGLRDWVKTDWDKTRAGYEPTPADLGLL